MSQILRDTPRIRYDAFQSKLGNWMTKGYKQDSRRPNQSSLDTGTFVGKEMTAAQWNDAWMKAGGRTGGSKMWEMFVKMRQSIHRECFKAIGEPKWFGDLWPGKVCLNEFM